MDKQKNKTKSVSDNTRNSSEFYTLKLDNENYILTKEVIINNVEEKILRMKRWYSPKLKILSFSNGKLELNCTHQDSSENLTILIEKDKLQISCSCYTEVQMLCFHAYKVLDSLAWFGETDYFQQFKPNGLYEIANSHKKMFEIKPNEKGLNISPKPGLGIIYSLENDLHVKQLTGALRIAVKEEIKPVPFPDHTALTYIIVQSNKNRLLPFLVPCVGKLNKSKDFMKGFGGFISGAQKEYDKCLNKEQRILNKLSYNTWRIVENLTSSVKDNDPEEMHDIQLVYDFWQSVIPVLRLQPFLHLYFMYWKKELKKRPSKSRIQTIRIGSSEPELRFRLINKGDFYQFDLRIFVKNKEIKAYIASPTFFIQDFEIDTLFLLASLRDAAIVEWMKVLKNKITIFKEHYREFEDNIMKQLQQCYTIEIIEFKNK